MAKIGIYGGTFNPVHLGHISVAESVVSGTDVKRVAFLPNGNPHYKSIEYAASPIHRYNMLDIATAGYGCFEVSDYELNKSCLCYTVDTMRYFRNSDPQNEYCFIIGADSLDYLHRWKDSENLIKENEFIVINRNFRQDYNLDKNIEYISSLGGKVTKADMPICDISSSMIREMLYQGKDVSEFTGRGVYEYIIKNQLYIGRNSDDH